MDMDALEESRRIQREQRQHIRDEVVPRLRDSLQAD
jgi:hypothetical protein